jgi:hypothetical protein
MATKKQKQELIETLKFTPRTYTITLSGYGGECYAGLVDRKIYDFFAAKQIDINQYDWEWDQDKWRDIPESMQPFSPGDAYDCDNLFHAAGAELSDTNYITVSDEHGDTHWEHSLGFTDLIKAGVEVECSSETEFGDLDDGSVVFWGGQGEKGCFFEAAVELRAPFNPAKLKILYEECDGWPIVSYVEYDGEELDGSGGYSTNGKWAEAKWIVIGEEEYEGVEREDGYEAEVVADLSDESVSAFSNLVQALSETMWNDASIKPALKGEYECEFAVGKWPSGKERTAEWTGRSWRENGKKADTILRWREITE